MLLRIATSILFLTASSACSSHGKIIVDMTPCENLEKIHDLPIKSDVPSSDPHYNEIVSMGKKAELCLIERIADETPMEDPRSAPRGPGQFVVGDLAFFLLDEIGSISLDEALPGDVAPSNAMMGIHAYFEWVNQPGNRQALQATCRRLVESHLAR